MILQRRGWVLGVSWALLAVGVWIAYLLPANKPVPIRRPLKQLPAEIGPWSMIHETDPSDLKMPPGVDDAILRVYSDGQGHQVEIFVEFFGFSCREMGPHPPEVCMSGSGWVLGEASTQTLDLKRFGLPAVSFRRIEARKGPVAGLMYFCYKFGNRYYLERGGDLRLWDGSDMRASLDYYLNRFQTVTDAIRHGRNDSLMIRATCFNSNPEDASTNDVGEYDPAIRDCLSWVVPVLENEFFPK